ncbi:MAG: hypothetical protein ACRDF4_08270, partial [Rhabdochlamydiaceae bacterium]
EISGARSRISSLTAQLGRASKKFDHESGRKIHLLDFVEDPINRIRSESDYDEFKALLAELKSSIDSGAIEQKSIPKANESLSEVMNFDIYAAVLSLRSLESRRSGLADSIGLLKITLGRLSDSKNAHEKIISDIESTKASAEDISLKIKNTKSSIERTFLEHYGKSIRIVDRADITQLWPTP